VSFDQNARLLLTPIKNIELTLDTTGYGLIFGWRGKVSQFAHRLDLRHGPFFLCALVGGYISCNNY